jgi:hypothetical protein
MGATEITISKTSSGAWNTADTLMFLKVRESTGVFEHRLTLRDRQEISSDGVSATGPVSTAF